MTPSNDFPWANDSPWETHASRWQHVGAPLRPSAQDLKIVQETLARCADTPDTVHALLLGVTAEITALTWPSNTTLVAVDTSQAMIQRHWQAPRSIHAFPVLGRWQRMPLQSQSIDFTIADGSLSIQANAAALSAVIASLAHTMRPRATFVLRAFVRPASSETPDQVFQAMHGGQIGSFAVLKWRLLMSLHESSNEGVPLRQVYKTFRTLAPSSQQLSKQLGWPAASIDTIESYRGTAARYFFPTLIQLRELLARYFDEMSCHIPSYELGHCCPTLVLSRTPHPHLLPRGRGD